MEGRESQSVRAEQWMQGCDDNREVTEEARNIGGEILCHHELEIAAEMHPWIHPACPAVDLDESAHS